MTPQEWLLRATKRASELLTARIRGTYFAPSEEILANRELYDAITAVEEERHQRELVDRR